MDTESCPRCVAERQARRVRLAMNAVALLTIAAGAVPCFASCSMSWAMDVPEAYTVQEAMSAEALGAQGVTLALLLACVVGLLGAIAGRLARRAGTPLPPPAVDATAHYREGPPTACARHAGR